MTFLRKFGLTVALVLSLLAVTVPAMAQTTLNSSTLSAAVTETTNRWPLTSVSNITAGDVIFVDREAVEVSVVNTASVDVKRGVMGTNASPHPTLAPFYSGPKARFYGGVKRGACTRASEAYLPRIVLPAGEIWDCPTGAQHWTLMNSPATMTVRSEAFNLDNGSGTTIDAVLIRPARAIVITACRIVYEDATTGTVAGGSAKVGTTVGGAEIVAATNYENTKAVGTTTAMTIVLGFVPSGTPVLVRHTGVAVTNAGEAVVECDYHYV